MCDLNQKSRRTEAEEKKPETLTTSRAAELRDEVVMWVESLAEQLLELQMVVEVGLFAHHRRALSLLELEPELELESLESLEQSLESGTQQTLLDLRFGLALTVYLCLPIFED